MINKEDITNLVSESYGHGEIDMIDNLIDTFSMMPSTFSATREELINMLTETKKLVANRG